MKFYGLLLKQKTAIHNMNYGSWLSPVHAGDPIVLRRHFTMGLPLSNFKLLIVYIYYYNAINLSTKPSYDNRMGTNLYAAKNQNGGNGPSVRRTVIRNAFFDSRYG